MRHVLVTVTKPFKDHCPSETLQGGNAQDTTDETSDCDDFHKHYVNGLN